MSPILVRPVREQLEHDRVIRLLQAKYKRKFDVAINPGNEQAAPVGGPPPWFPDLVLYTMDKNRKLAGVIEVESAESVNHLEAMSQWKAFSALRVPFHLYLPTSSVDTARRFCADMDIPVAEMWAYQSVGDQIRFAVIQRTTPVPAAETKPARGAAAPSAEAEPPARPRPAARPAAARAGNSRPAAARPAGARPAATPARTPAARARAAGETSRRPATRRPATAAAKPKAGAVRRPAAKAAARKTKGSSPSRAQKRR